MSPNLTGAVVGLVLGVADFVVLGFAAAKPGLADAGRSAINAARYATIVLFPILGWFLGPIIAGE